jgi:tRNA-specific 2-thiouridylase
MSESNSTRVIVGMSGGVDSSVSALLLMQQGYHVEGLFMKNWDEDDGTEYCTAKQDLADAQAVCDKLGIHLHAANFAAEYWDNVFEHFLAEYKAGRTPNPDILCNREIKFKAFLDYAKVLGADYIATGHYVQRTGEGINCKLVKGLDGNKDQSYFLHAVGALEVSQTLFPIGAMEKPEVRMIAEAHGLANHAKKDSTGICFIGERRFKDFLQDYLPAHPGKIETVDGDVIGDHQGLMYHTIGQRQGLGIGGLANYNESAWYVVDKDLDRNRLIVTQGKNHPSLFKSSLTCQQLMWVDGIGPDLSPDTSKGTQSREVSLMAKIRYRQADQQCTITALSSGNINVVFAEPQRAVTPGQSIVFYDGQVCLGGAVID